MNKYKMRGRDGPIYMHIECRVWSSTKLWIPIYYRSAWSRSISVDNSNKPLMINRYYSITVHRSDIILILWNICHSTCNLIILFNSIFTVLLLYIAYKENAMVIVLLWQYAFSLWYNEIDQPIYDIGWYIYIYIYIYIYEFQYLTIIPPPVILIVIVFIYF